MHCLECEPSGWTLPLALMCDEDITCVRCHRHWRICRGEDGRLKMISLEAAAAERRAPSLRARQHASA